MGAAAIMSTGMLLNIDIVWRTGSARPAVANTASPALTSLFAIILLLASTPPPPLCFDGV